MEVWKPISSLEGYEASSLGRIRSPQGLILKQNKDHWGYWRVTVKTPSGRRRMRVHGLVLGAFYCPRPEGLECRHLNGDRTDNRPENLRWGTSAENKADMAYHGTRLSGPTHPRGNAKLSPGDVVLVRSSADSGASWARRLGVNESAIRKIRQGLSWAHV